MSIDYKKLQNGSDVRGIALEGIEGQHVNLTNEAAATIAKSFALWLSEKQNKPVDGLLIAVGRDSRISGPALSQAVMTAMCEMGVSVIDCGMATTPAMFMSLVTPGFEYDGSIMITASHLPFNRNGLKFFVRTGGLDKGDITEILSTCEGLPDGLDAGGGSITKVDFMESYAEHFRNKITSGVGGERPLEGLKIVVDAGNGAGGFFATKVLAPLGADINGSLFLDPDGTFPNHIPNPEDKVAMSFIQKAVIDSKADLGLIFDTDVDRAAAVDSDGSEFNRNRLIALISAIILQQHKGTYIVTDSVTSTGLADFIKEKGGVHLRFKRGYKNVINKGIELNKAGTDCQIMIETSGHAALKENYFLDDGAYLAVKLVIELAKLRKQGKTLGSLIDSLAEPVESAEYRLNISGEDFGAYGAKVVKELTEYSAKQTGWTVADDNYEGIRVYFDRDNGDGWFLLRVSLHDPVIPVNIESDSAGGENIIREKLYAFLKGYDRLDLSAMEK